jgi:hypothetical protein
MGSWNLSCSVSRYTVGPGDRVYVYPLVPSDQLRKAQAERYSKSTGQDYENPLCTPDVYSYMFPWDLYTPIEVPAVGRYDDYGRFIFDEKDQVSCYLADKYGIHEACSQTTPLMLVHEDVQKWILSETLSHQRKWRKKYPEQYSIYDYAGLERALIDSYPNLDRMRGDFHRAIREKCDIELAAKSKGVDFKIPPELEERISSLSFLENDLCTAREITKEQALSTGIDSIPKETWKKLSETSDLSYHMSAVGRVIPIDPHHFTDLPRNLLVMLSEVPSRQVIKRLRDFCLMQVSMYRYTLHWHPPFQGAQCGYDLSQKKLHQFLSERPTDDHEYG